MEFNTTPPPTPDPQPVVTQRMVGFGEAISRAFSNYCNFKGRASRSEYWWFALFAFIISFIPSLVYNIAAVEMIIHPHMGMPGYGTVALIILVLIGLAFLLPSLGLAWRRLHDTGHSGALVLIPIVLSFFGSVISGITQSGFVSVIMSLLILAASIYLLVLYCIPSNPTENQYGPVPNVG